MDKAYIIGITGGSASGKTVFLKNLLNTFSENEVCLISQDNYYKPLELQSKDKNGVVDFDTPSSIDFDAYTNDIKALRAGEKVQRTEYTFNNPAAIPQQLIFRPAPIIVVEGIFVFHLPHLLELLDLKIFIDAEEHIKLRRRIARDKIERGYDLEDVLYRYEHHVAPAYEKFIRPHKGKADMIIPNNKHFDTALAVLTPFLKQIVNHK